MFNRKLKIGVMSMCLAMAMSTSVFAADLIKNSTFENGMMVPWNAVETTPADADFNATGGIVNLIVKNAGTNNWDIQFRHGGLTIEKDHTYNIQFTAKAAIDCKVYAKIGEVSGTYNEYWNNSDNPGEPFNLVAGVPLVVNQTFTMKDATTSTCDFAFFVAGKLASASLPNTVSFSNIHITDPQFPGYKVEEGIITNDIRANQLGYFTNLKKVATLVSTSNSPLTWSLKDSTSKIVATGNTVVKGFDHASGENVHTIDFSTFTTEGNGYKLSVNGKDSFPFDITNSLYSKLKLSALNYFYQNRSGIDIVMPYALREDLTRKAGIDDSALTPFDTSSGTEVLNVSKGWFDAGDHGKYVVNGGISVWTLMNQYENALYYGDVTKAPIADNTMGIPESGNKVPDILDEIRWEMDFMLGMQSSSGMAYHSAHDVKWTGIPTRPDQDIQKRYLYPVTTAATLNLAATAAQASRLWTKYDANYSSTCLTAAEKAWKAALSKPSVYAAERTYEGGGDYGDKVVSDEFYWAACELYATTGKDEYLNYMRSSSFYLKMPEYLNWGNMAALGTITLAMVPTELSAGDITTAKANIKTMADTFIANESSNAYGAAIKEGPNGYNWGSNSDITNNAIVMGYAYQFTKDEKYINGVATAMDYLLGRNPNMQSYITGYGTNPLRNPHHRFWAYQANNAYPKAPPGCISGGPNSSIEDPWVLGLGWKPGAIASQKAFADNIASYSTNEITVNWNAPLAWITGFMDQSLAPTQPTLVYGDGDVNGDGKVNVADYIIIKRYISKNITVFPVAKGLVAADINADGVIDTTDTDLVKQYILSKISKLPIK